MIKKRHLELLAFGKAGMIALVASPKWDTQDSVYVTENGNFKIPKVFSDEERDKLYKLVWSGETEFSRMEKEVKEHLSTWKNLKKMEKLRERSTSMCLVWTAILRRKKRFLEI